MASQRQAERVVLVHGVGDKAEAAAGVEQTEGGELENAWHRCMHIAIAAACASATLASTVALAAAATASAAGVLLL